MKCFCGLFFLLAMPISVGQELTIRKNTELVQFPVVVTKEGLVVRGLNKDAFEVIDNGMRQPVAVFEEIEAKRTIVTRQGAHINSVQNFARGDERQDVVIIVFDFLNGSWSTSARIRSFLKDLSKQVAAEGIPASVLLLSKNGLVQVHSFTSSPEDFVKATELWSRKEAPSPDLSQIPNWQSPYDPTDPLASFSVLREYAVGPGYVDAARIDKAATTLMAVQQIAQAFRGVPGRKKLVWMSTCFLGTLCGMGESASVTFNLHDKRVRAGNLLSDANIVVYPIDSNGVVNPTWEEHFSPAHGGSGWLPPVSLEMPSDVRSLMEAAQKTGGQHCSDLPTLCLTKITQDAQHYYILGYYLRSPAQPGWHAVKIRVGSYSVRTRDGFYVGEEPRKEGKSPAKPAVAKTNSSTRLQDNVMGALSSPLDYTSIPLRLTWAVNETQAGKTVQLVLTSPAGGVSNADDGSVNIDYLAFVKSAKEKEGKSYPVSMRRKLSDGELSSLRANGFVFKKDLQLASGNYEVRVLLRDNTTGKIGTVSALVAIP